jgi:hypothetical protein
VRPWSWGKTLKEKKMTKKTALGLAALALGTALGALPAFAQEYHYSLGRGMNDGGFAAQNQNQNRGEPRTGTAANNRRTGITNPAPRPQAYNYSLGRGMNDGGFAVQSTGDQRTGTAANDRENGITGPRRGLYAYGGEGRPGRGSDSWGGW